jgi:hypothetical protein
MHRTDVTQKDTTIHTSYMRTIQKHYDPHIRWPLCKPFNFLILRFFCAPCKNFSRALPSAIVRYVFSFLSNLLILIRPPTPEGCQ